MMRVGIAGLGKMGKLHFMSSMKMDNIDVVAAADLKKGNLKIAKDNHVKTYQDYKEMLDKEDLDAVIISLPNFLKKESVIYASEKDVAIFIDKPIARNITETREIYNKITSTNSQLMVGTNYRYFDNVRKVKNKIDDGNIGQVLLSNSELIMDGPFSHPLIPKQVPDWWFEKEKSGGGVLLDLGYHLLDLNQWMFGDCKIEYAVLNHFYNLPIEDSATIVMSADNDIRCVVNVGWFSKMIFPQFNFRINLHGTVGYTSTDQYTPSNLYVHAMKTGISNFLRKITGRRIKYLEYTYYYSSFVKILSDFFNSVKNDLEMPVNMHDQLSVMNYISTIYEKSEE